MDESFRDTAQICLNGHVINTSFHESPEFNKKFCSECGLATITACPDCEFRIAGYLNMPGHVSLLAYRRPAYCENCGKPYPWTDAHLRAARQLAYESTELGTDDKDLLADSLDDLVRDTPRTPVAIQRVKRVLGKVAPGVAEGFRSILVDVVSEAVRKSIWPG